MSVLKTYGANVDDFHPSKTWRLSGNRLQGMIDGVDAVKQSVDYMLSTERFYYDIYSYDYGAEFSGLIGKDKSYIKADIERVITEAVLQDDRVTGVTDFEITFDRDTANVKFIVITDFGNFTTERGVPIGRGI